MIGSIVFWLAVVVSQPLFCCGESNMPAPRPDVVQEQVQ